METGKLGARTLARGKGLEDFSHADVAGDAVVRRHLAGAIEPVAGTELGAQHDEARCGLDVEGAEQPRIDAERTGRVAGAPDGSQALLERLAVSLREAAQHGGVDMHFRDHEGLADVRAALLLDDSDELGLEAAVRGGIGELQDVRHPVVEAFGCPVEEHQRRVAGDELEIGCVDPAARHGDPLGGNRHQHNLLVAGDRGAEADQRGQTQDSCQHGKAVALPKVGLRLFVREFCSHGSPPSARQQAAVGGRRGLQPEKAPG